ncbi:MAG: RNA methyltransferase, partial [Solobacterium sp.]|nr:RNA methyltransferase [Solobacterium sp.]
DALVTSEYTCDFYNEKVIRSTQGSLFHIPLLRRDLPSFVKELKDDGVFIAATALKDAKPLSEPVFPERTAVILGNEGNGVRQELLELADVIVKIEMSGFESLNVAVAGGIMMYRLRKEV